MTFLPKLRRASDKHLVNAASGIAGLQQRIIELEASLTQARALMRTPGTVEVCATHASGATCEGGGSALFGGCDLPKCPLKATQLPAGCPNV